MRLAPDDDDVGAKGDGTLDDGGRQDDLRRVVREAVRPGQVVVDLLHTHLAVLRVAVVCVW
ncbi:MAG: hypothetical protein IPG17_20000 [Sandaracinaceae bacterium]|nr:hypothetical protein [Sandaracinaceae bacterium]